jgi:tetratricopeptide (TPR) repeat protein
VSARLIVVVAPSRAAADAEADARVAGHVARHPQGGVGEAPSAAAWPFIYPFPSAFTLRPPAVIRIRDLDAAFVNRQTSGTRLVTTQAAYLMQVWLDATPDSTILIASADAAVIRAHAPEVIERRGLFMQADVCELDGASTGEPTDAQAIRDPAIALLARAFRADDAAERLSLCVRALELGRTVPALVATASACMEVNDFDAAARDLDDALRQAPDWAAAQFERGKLWLRRDDMEQASARFGDAARLMPTFAPAWANLGAALGELDRPGEALHAFERALGCDPSSHQTLNNIGVVTRELGRLAESEAAFRRVITLAPDLAFGYYNLGHTLFLQGRYRAALGAYIDGQKRDPGRNPVQASRLAMCRLATGDAPGALNELQRATNALPRDYRQQLLADTNAVAWALLTHRPDLPGWQLVNDWLSSELARLA